MRSWALAALLAGSAAASPRPQGIDWDAVNALPDLPTISIPVVDAEAAQTTVAYEPTQAAAAVEAAVLANPKINLWSDARSVHLIRKLRGNGKLIFLILLPHLRLLGTIAHSPI